MSALITGLSALIGVGVDEAVVGGVGQEAPFGRGGHGPRLPGGGTA